MANKYHKNVGQIILRWHLQDGIIAIPKATTPEHIIGNLELFDFSLSDEKGD